MRLRLSKPTPAFVVAVAALVVSLGGTSYAVSQLGSSDIRDNSIRSVDLRDDTVRSVDIADGTLRVRDFRDGVLQSGPRGLRGLQGIQGNKGDQGDQGDQGIQGPAGAGRWLLMNADGTIAASSGGFEVVSAYDLVNNTGATVPGGALGNVYIDANEPLTNNGIVASIALQNKTDQNGDAVLNGRADGSDLNPEFSGEISATMCAITMVVACAPTGADNTSTFVVSPRMSDGRVTVSPVAAGANPAVIGTHKRFYIIITGDSTDYVAPIG